MVTKIKKPQLTTQEQDGPDLLTQQKITKQLRTTLHPPRKNETTRKHLRITPQQR